MRLAAVVGAVLLASGAAAAAPRQTVTFRVYATTKIKLTDVVWTGSQFLYLENTTNQVWAAGPRGTPAHRFADMPDIVEETRCRIPPGESPLAYVQRDVYCHSPDNVIYRLTSDGKRIAVLARLPETSVSDGALAFDTTGAFGHSLLAVTGRSGSTTLAGGAAYSISPTGKVTLVGRYSQTGGADEAMVAPKSFGSAAGQLLVTIDAGSTGQLVAISARGHNRTLATFPDGLNPIVAATTGRATRIPAGLYVTDTFTGNVLFAPAAQLGVRPGDVIVGSEVQGRFWVVRPSARGFTTTELQTSLAGGSYNLEGAIYVP